MKRSYSRYQRGYDDNIPELQNIDGVSKPKRRKTTLLQRLTVSSGRSSIFRKRTKSATRHQSLNIDVNTPDVPKRSPGPRHKKPKLLRENSIQLTTREGVEIEVMSYCDDGVASKDSPIEEDLIEANINDCTTIMKGINDDGSPRRPRRRHEAHKSQNDHQTVVEINISCHGDDEPMANKDKLFSNALVNNNQDKNENTDGYLCNKYEYPVSQDEKARNDWSPTRPRRRYEIEQDAEEEDSTKYSNDEVEGLGNSLETINIDINIPPPMSRNKASLSSKKRIGRKSLRKSIKFSKKKCKLM